MKEFNDSTCYTLSVGKVKYKVVPVISHHVLKTYGGPAFKLHALLTSTLAVRFTDLQSKALRKLSRIWVLDWVNSEPV
jgi:hypothetical protein